MPEGGGELLDEKDAEQRIKEMHENARDKIVADRLAYKLELRKADLWTQLKLFARNRDAHGVHDMAVEIQGIEIVLSELGMRTCS